jgi:alcohol dehydrogenase class IV
MTTDFEGPAEPGKRTGAGVGAEALAPWTGFSVARLPRILFGGGTSGELGAVVREFGRKALVIVRAPGFTDSLDWVRLLVAMETAGVEVALESVTGEPSPTVVDGIVARHRGSGSGSGAASGSASGAASAEVVVGIGGGSVLDTAKAVAGLLIPGNSVMDHLEGVGPELPYRGPSVPFVAVPTTAGTGSEATKNAVLSVRGPGGFKKSFRDEMLVARVAIIDPDLLATCPPALIAGNGMDALTQLLESYVSTKANPFTDALALSGLAAVRDGLEVWFDAASSSSGAAIPAAAVAVAAARGRMAYAALCSGICLAQAGLGSVHGLASPLGAQFPIPHGAACGATLVAATRVNISALESREPGNRALLRYAAVGRLFAGSALAAVADVAADVAADDDRRARTSLVSALESLTAGLGVARLSAFGITESSVPALVADSRGSSMKTNPVVLTDDEIAEILRASL